MTEIRRAQQTRDIQLSALTRELVTESSMQASQLLARLAVQRYLALIQGGTNNEAASQPEASRVSETEAQ
jgi:hypothetical protein